MMNVQSKTS